MAVAKDTVVAICLAGTTIDVSNSDDALYPAYSFVPDPTQLLDTENHVWANYALAAYKGAHDFLAVNPAAETDISRSYPGIKVPLPPAMPHGTSCFRCMRSRRGGCCCVHRVRQDCMITPGHAAGHLPRACVHACTTCMYAAHISMVARVSLWDGGR